MTDDKNFLDGYKRLSEATMDPQMDRQIWNCIESELRKHPTSSTKSEGIWKSTIGSLIAACVAVAVVVGGGIYSLNHSSSKTAVEQHETAAVSAKDFSLSFVPEPSKVVPSWLDNGNGMVLSVTLNKWAPPTDNNAGYYVIVPTTADPSNVVSMYDYPDGHSEPQGFNPTWGVGPDGQTNAINSYLSQHHLATLSLREESVLTPRGNTQNINFEVVVGSANGAKLQPSDLRLVVLKLHESGNTNHFNVLGSLMFSPYFKNPEVQQYPAFSPPENMRETFSIPSNDGQLRVIGYGDPTDPNIYARQLYVLTNNSGSTARVLYHLDASNDLLDRDQLFWFGKGSQEYLALNQNVSITPEEAGGKLVIKQFTTSTSGTWLVSTQTTNTMPGGRSYRLDATHLLFESSGIGIQTPVQYTFSQNGVSYQPVTEQYPRQGEIPNSITRTIHVTGTPASGGTTNYEITGDFSPLHMKVGQKLVIQVIYNVKPKLPLGVLMYPDVGDPGAGNLASYDASPYVDAKVFTLVHTAKHGQVVISPEVVQGVKPGPKTPTGIIKIPIVVQK